MPTSTKDIETNILADPPANLNTSLPNELPIFQHHLTSKVTNFSTGVHTGTITTHKFENNFLYDKTYTCNFCFCKSRHRFPLQNGL